LIALECGGELVSSTPASGPVQVAIQPWELELADPADGAFADLVVSVHRDRGAVAIRCARVTIQIPSDKAGALLPSAGAPIGVRVSPSHVRVLAAR
jgi:hypothetical protein